MDITLVTGGTGTLGRHVVHRLRDSGRNVRVLTRRTGKDEDSVRFVTGDLLSGRGIGAAVDRVTAIIHCAGSYKGDEVATQNLLCWSKAR
jgi:nucleoside-diphosphate-sugar epimerase